MTPEERAAQNAALRLVLEIAERYPEIPMPDFPAVGTMNVSWWLRGGNSARHMALLEEALPCKLTASVKQAAGGTDRYQLTGDLGGYPVEISAEARLVAEPTVVAQRTEDVIEWARLSVEPGPESGES